MKRKKKIIFIFFSLLIFLGVIFAGYALTLTFANTPEFVLPIHNIAEVTGIQVFHDNSSTQIHIGFDFKLENLTEIFSPISGRITNIKKHQMSNGYWIVDLNIQVNVKWSMFIAFEPWTQDETIIDQQLASITVKTGEKVEIDQSLGFLTPVVGSEFPHIHWTIQRYSFKEGKEPVSPYDYCTLEAQLLLWELCKKFGKLPEDPLI